MRPYDAAHHDVLFRAIFDRSREAIGVSYEGVHVVANESYLRLFRYDSVEELFGKPILGLIAPESRDTIAEYIRRRAAGLAVPDQYITRGLRKDGDTFELGVRVTTATLYDLTYTVVMLHDVTEENAARRALEQSQAFYRALFEGNSAVKLLIDPTSGRIVDANPAAAAFYGWPLHVLRTLHIEAISTLEGDEIERILAGALHGQTRHYESRHRQASGAQRDVEVYTGPVDVGERRLLLSIVHDITERRTLEGRLIAEQRMDALGKLAGRVAHDFNNLLTIILANADLLDTRLDAGTTEARAARRILEASRRAASLTQQLLALGSRQAVRPIRLCLPDVVRGVEDLLRAALGTDITLIVELPRTHGPCVIADQGQIDQVLMNLAGNARDAMPNGGTARLGVTVATLGPDDPRPVGVEPGRWAVLSFRDSGVGMDEATRARVFEPFYTTKSTGKGLGLASVYGIIEQSHGRITVESAVGEGTTFNIYLPLVEEGASSQTNTRRRATIARNVLVVDDEPHVRELVAHAVRQAGHAAHEAKDGFDALLLRDGLPGIDLLVTDLVMPGLGGLDLYRLLVTRQPDLPLVIVTGAIGPHDVLPDRAFVVHKPFTQADIARVLADAFATEESP